MLKYLILALLGLSFCGARLPVGDALAVVRLHLAALLALSALYSFVRGARKSSSVLLVLAALVLCQLLSGFFRAEEPTTGNYTLYQKNLHRKSWPRYSLADEMVSIGADFVTLQEVSEHNLRFMEKLFRSYPSKTICNPSYSRGVAVMSRFPMVPGSSECADDDSLALMQVLLPTGKTIWLASLHLHWPFPFDQAEHKERIAARLSVLEGPILLGGDFNMVPWGSSVVQIAKAAGARRVGPYRVSFSKFGFLLPLPIDHIMLPDGVTGGTEVRPMLGSDHLGLLAWFDL